MNLSGLLELVRAQEAYRALLADPGRGESLGLPRAARAFVVAGLAADLGLPLLVVTGRAESAHNLAEQLPAWWPNLHVLTYAAPHPLFYERAEWGPRARRARLQTLARLIEPQGKPPVIVGAARALMQRTLPPGEFVAATRSLRPGERATPDGLLRDWLRIGYQPASITTEPGTFSRRGGIVDVFPVAAPEPVRIEFWGDQIETLRAFDPATQRTTGPLDSIIITPAREALPAHGPEVAARLADWFAGFDPAEPDSPAAERESLAQGEPFPTLEFYLPWMSDGAASLLDFLPPDALIVVDDWGELQAAVADLERQALDLRETYQASGAIPPDAPLPYITWEQLAEDISRGSHLELGGETPEGEARLGRLFAPGPRFAGQLWPFVDHLRHLHMGGDRVVVVSRQAERLAELWAEGAHLERGGEHDCLTPVEVLDEPPAPGVLTFVHGALSDGWLFKADDAPTHLLTDAEIFGWKRPEPRRSRRPRAFAPEDFFADLTPGDFVVHVEYGIGRFQGLEKHVLDGTEREFLLVNYAGGDSLYVPIHQADRLSRYVGPDDRPPVLSRLGTAEWAQVKGRVQQAVEEMAGELLELYAAREVAPGHAFGSDTPWQAELEAAFPYVETEDQLRALREVKADMERPRPMDRLICGDVGYGKTEVALRASFKAVMEGKQVAVLVPTTVLAQQHYETFARRLAAFPVNVEVLSRFRTRAEQEEVVRGLADGRVDIVIGTHRLLSEDVRFKDLGLLIIDEEQRFGVTHKERLKQMRTEVDVLTLTATPIPRTLYMGLVGVRDISTINTPPEERLPIVTHVGVRDDDLIRRAILRELERGGQVFYVHNRVQTIYAEARRLCSLVPEASIEVGHGQMFEADLEAVMHRFVAGEVDVLVSTNIIEAGLDIPNANTLIVDHAEHFGLAQLYQLRGRVGRSAARAYAYFFYPSARVTPEAYARLQTIAEQSELGVGFGIAMRDLELRGAGDILGTRQSGHIAAVGFHLYTRLLGQAVQRLRAEPGQPVRAEPAAAGVVAVDLPIPTYIPTDYVPEAALRIQLYRRMADLRSEEEIDEMAAELEDRFGRLPVATQNLLYQLRVKVRALRANVEAVASSDGQVAIRVAGLDKVDRRDLQAALGHDVRVSRVAIWLPRRGDETWRGALLDILARLNQALPSAR
jgi:transcription-repair coupling factor (superfamily II helicase)